MDLKVLFLIVFYYTIFTMVYALGGAYMDGYSVNATMPSHNLTSSETDSGGIFSIGVSFARFFGFVLFGIGIDGPAWFTTIFFLWQTIITMLSIGFVISAIWNG